MLIFNFYTSFSTSPLFTAVVVFFCCCYGARSFLSWRKRNQTNCQVSDCVEKQNKNHRVVEAESWLLSFWSFPSRALCLLSIWNRYSCDSNGKTEGKITLTGWFCLSLLIWLTLLIHIYVLTVWVWTCLFWFSLFSFAAHCARTYRLTVKCAHS